MNIGRFSIDDPAIFLVFRHAEARRHSPLSRDDALSKGAVRVLTHMRRSVSVA